jgi:hypothetical protein
MRYAGFTLAVLLIGVVVAQAQPPVTGAPVQPPPLPGANP